MVRRYLSTFGKVLVGALVLAAFVLVTLLSGCSSRGAGVRGGVATIGKAVLSPFTALGEKVAKSQPAKIGATAPKEPAGVGDVASIQQPDNPNAQSSQNYGFERTDEIVYSQPTQIITETRQPDGSSIVVTENVPAGSKRKSSVVQSVGQVIGSAHEDKSGELAAKLGSFKIVQYLGIAAFLLGAVAYFHPVLRTLIGGKDTALVVNISGLVMIFGPYLFVQYSNYFFGAVLIAAVYWVISRLKYKEGQLDTLTSTPPFGPKP